MIFSIIAFKYLASVGVDAWMVVLEAVGLCVADGALVAGNGAGACSVGATDAGIFSSSSRIVPLLRSVDRALGSDLQTRNGLAVHLTV